jgi:DNA gyrase subunit A
MAATRERIVPVYLEDEMRSSFLDYAMSVIVARALPDVRDGLKPVHRRILYAMKELGLLHNRPFRKCATVVGDVLGKYHPHGEMAIYDALVRMAQDFSLRYPLIDGQGNFGSVDGDAAAAYRYTESRLMDLAEEILEDIEKDTVDFVPNFDGRLKEPRVLPSKVPNLLLNGSDGIAVGMATNIPSHNLQELADGLIAIINNPEVTTKTLLKKVTGPDFPTGGIIVGRKGIEEAYLTGKGKILIRGKTLSETTKGGKERIIISELPYQVNKASLIEKIASLVREKKIEGISDLRDESDKDGMRIVLDLKRDGQKEVIVNQLLKRTQLQTTYGIILLVLVDDVPRVLSLKEHLEKFLEHRHDVILRRTKFDLEKAEKRAHIVEGLKIALDHIDEIVALLKKSRDAGTARNSLMKRFKLSEPQAQAILDMRLVRLTSLERKQLDEEYLTLIKEIERLKSILSSRQKVMELIKNELKDLVKKYGDDRRTEIREEEEEDFELLDLIAEEDMVVSVTHQGYIKRLTVTSYRRQGRGGKGVAGVQTKEDDFPERIFIGSTHDNLLFFTEGGRCYSMKIHEIPEAGRYSRGRSITNLLSIPKDEKIRGVIPIRSFNEGECVVMVTRQGIIKKTSLKLFSNIRRTGIIACNVDKGDKLVLVSLTDGSQDLVLISRDGLAIRFHEKDVREMGRTARGVRGIRLKKDDFVVGAVTVKREATLLCVTENGYGKRSPLSDFRITRRGGKGIVAIRTSDRNGKVVAALEALDTDELLMISSLGQVIRIRVESIRTMGRSTQGVRLMDLKSGVRVVDVARIESEDT